MSLEALLALFGHFLTLSVFATGGAMALASDMHRYVVDEHAYITHTQFVKWCEERSVMLPSEINEDVISGYRRYLYHYTNPLTGKERSKVPGLFDYSECRNKSGNTALHRRC